MDARGTPERLEPRSAAVLLRRAEARPDMSAANLANLAAASHCADLAFDDAGRPYSPRYRDVYRSRAGASGEARAVFIDGCRLRERWRGRDRFAIVELGFGLGVNFLATLAAWRADPQRPQRLDYVSVELHPLDADSLAQALAAFGADGDDVRGLLDAWPLPLPGLHRIRFADGGVTLTLAFGDAERMAGRLPVAADAFYLDGFAPSRNPRMWSPGLMKSLARLARPGATLATYSAAHAVREALVQAGFEVRLAPGFGGKLERIVAEYAPRWRTHSPPSGPLSWPWREAVVVGAGLAGTAVASALSRRGWRVALLDRHSAPCAEGSAQPLVADHLHVAPDDNPLARLSRAALLLERAHFPGPAPIGKLQVADSDAEHEQQAACMRALGFPEHFVRVLDAEAAADATGMRVSRGGLWLPLCDAADPAARCQAQLQPRTTPATGAPPDQDQRTDLAAGSGSSEPSDVGAIVFRPGCEVARIDLRDGLWHALATDGGTLACAPVLVLANAGDAVRLAGQGAIALRRVRGQTTLLARDALPGLRAVLGGDAYACPLPGGGALVGSSFDDGDTLAPDPQADLSNLRRLSRMLAPEDAEPERLFAASRPGACGFRFVARDRLPLVGQLPDEAAIRSRAAEFARNDRLPLPMLSGLYGAFAFGSRGLLWSGLAAEILAAEIDGGAAPVETDLLAALAPARFLRQQLRRRRLR